MEDKIGYSAGIEDTGCVTNRRVNSDLLGKYWSGDWNPVFTLAEKELTENISAKVYKMSDISVVIAKHNEEYYLYKLVK